MGIGDEIMAAGEVKRRGATPAKPFAIWDSRKGGFVRSHFIWDGNPLIAKPGEPYSERLENRGGVRPYIVEKGWGQWHWKAYKPVPGDIYLTPLELKYAERAAGTIVLNPTLKDNASPNKRWPFWQELVDLHPGLPWLQIGDVSSQRLRGVRFMETPTFRDACGALYGARAAVLHEGGLHHAAAALKRPAIVLFGGFISPDCTGYQAHVNLFHATREHPLGCGIRVVCPHCKNIMLSFTAQTVAQKLKGVL